ncbi:NAD(P)H-dependent oxidoreductase [Shewanella gelidii]|uniref:Potassium transporter KefG n=1 Tax=Shewanella gelidii TaxID=1642821 RepID=A0A917N6Q4_9GAMM|nr:NAD(P)H-dependent oxidoreductase [Shewanella gelidii]MCL1096959.1 NAD(P)H-dependent oxidoreductase [Shewanella gelidii]GGI71499.1 potassium transporter KefG [Shewanella gelidii]
MTQKVLVLYAHPSQHRSEANQPLYEAASQMPHVTVVDLYAEYPTFNINIDREQQRLMSHDVIIFQFPLYWYSTPAILKEWQDLVLEYNFAYGSRGGALKNKVFFCAITAGGKAEAYRAEGFNHFKIREILYPLEQMASLTGMRYVAPFALFGARTAKEEGRVQHHTQQWTALLQALIEERFDVAKANEVGKIAPFLEELITEPAS